MVSHTDWGFYNFLVKIDELLSVVIAAGDANE